MNSIERPPAASLRTRVFDVLVARGISQRWLARQIGMTDTMVAHIKAGRRPISDRFIDGSVRALGLPFDLLFFVVPPSPEGDSTLRDGDAAG